MFTAPSGPNLATSFGDISNTDKSKCNQTPLKEGSKQPFGLKQKLSNNINSQSSMKSGK